MGGGSAIGAAFDGRDLRFILAAFLVAGAGSWLSLALMRRRERLAGRWRVLWSAGAVCSFSAGTWLTYALFVRGAFPSLDPVDSWLVDGQAILIAAAGTWAAHILATKARPGYRDPFLAGAVLAFATQTTVFFCLSQMTRPYRLAYEIGPLTGVVLFSAVVAGFGLSQATKGHGFMQRLQSVSCLAGVQILPVAVGLAAILPFSDWLSESRGAGLSTEPVVAVVSACALVILLLGVTGSAVDHYLAFQSTREATRLKQIVDGAMEGIVIHRGGFVLDANAAFCSLAGVAPGDLRGVPVSDFLDLPAGAGALSAELADGHGAEVALGFVAEREELDLRAFDGQRLSVEVLSRVIHYCGDRAHLLAIRDLRERRMAEARILHLAHHDGLTGLANRTLLNERLLHAFMLAERANEQVALLCLDLDRFKAVNDTLGHAAGDMLLRQVAERLRGAVRASDTVARTGGDEFLIIQVGNSEPHAVSMLAARVIEAISAPYDLDGQQASIGTSIGIAIYPQDALGSADLLKRADVALYRAKASGRGTSCFYEAGMDQKLRERQQMEADLRRAVISGEMELFYQPLVSCDTTAVTGFEALVRWNHPDRGRMGPSEFIALAEETGIIVHLGRWAIEAACREAVTWPGHLRVAVNLSPVQFRGDDVVATVAAALDRTGLEPSRLEIEVTESLLIVDTVQALDVLLDLKSLGVRIALDDFGTGYSSLSYLHRFPFDKLKIDRSFVQVQDKDLGARAIVQAILAMSRSLNLDVTAEGVETEHQLSVLQEQSCGTVQGFYLGRPMQAGAVLPFLRGEGTSPAPHSASNVEPGAHGCPAVLAGR